MEKQSPKATPKTVTTKAAPKVAAKAKAVSKPKPKPKQEIEMNPKMADPQSILEAYDLLIKQLARVESAQRNAKKPHRIYFVHRKRMEVMKMNFIKSMR